MKRQLVLGVLLAIGAASIDGVCPSNRLNDMVETHDAHALFAVQPTGFGKPQVETRLSDTEQRRQDDYR